MSRPDSAIASLLVFCMSLAGCSPTAGWEDDPFPEELALSRVVGSCQSGGFREGVVVAYFELAPGVAEEIARQDLAFFEDKVSGRGGAFLQPWARSPLEMTDGHNTVDSTGAKVYAWPMFGCGDRDNVAPAASESLVTDFDAGRAFYTTFNHGEGLLVVAPHSNIAAYFYFG